MGRAVTDRACPNVQCRMRGKAGRGNIRLHDSFKLKRGQRRHYRCKTCGDTFVSSIGTPYHRLKCARAQFDKVAAMSVEGLSRSAIARVMRTLAMQAGLVARRLTFRDVLTGVAAFLSFVAALIRVRWPREALALRLAAAQ